MSTEHSNRDAVELTEIAQRPNESHQEQPLRKPDYLKLISAAFSFFVAGVNDGSLGVLIPFIIRSYNVDTAIVSVVYSTTFLGWFFAAITNTHLCQFLDLGSMLVLGAALQLLAHALRFWLPPFPLFAITFWFASLGQAFQDTHANSFVASLRSAHRFLGFIHAMYMAGCLVGPFVGTAVASADIPSRWNLFYTFPFGLGALNIVLAAIAFRDSISIRLKPVSRNNLSDAHPNEPRSAMKLIKDTLRLPNVWRLSLFYFFFLGAAITAGGWVVEYLVVARNGNIANMGYVRAGLSGGGLLGRLLLAEPTHRWGERRMILLYCGLCMGLQLVFWLVPNIIAASIAISLLGFFSGPFFATGISVGSKLFPMELRSSALAFVFVFGQVGGSIFPILTGVLASSAGVKVLQPVLTGLLAATGVSWLMVPKPIVLHRE